MHFLSGVILFVVCSLISADADDKLKITVLYESLCPDSITFIQNQLTPNYEYIQDFVDINFIPFGKSSSINKGAEFECQHGPEECAGNRMQSCVLSQIESQETKVKFVACQMKKDVDFSGKLCTKEAGIDFGKVEECIKSDTGKQLQLEAEIITNTFDPKFVPTIVYNSVFDQMLTDRSRFEFLTVVCEQLKTKGLSAKLPKCV